MAAKPPDAGVSPDGDMVLRNHKAKWERLAHENDRYYVRSVDHEQSDEDYERSGRDNVAAFIEGDPALRARLDPLSERTVLEIGCGSGRMTKTLARLFQRVIGVDVSPTMLEKAARFVASGNAVFVESNGSDVPVAPNSVDLAFSYIVYQHFPSREAIEESFKGVWNALRSDGLFKVQLRGAPHADPSHWSWGPHFDAEDAEALFKASRFRSIGSQGVGTRSYWHLLERE